MRHLKSALAAEILERLVRIHVQITGIGAHVAGDEARRVEYGRIGILDSGDVRGLDPQFALHVQQRLAHRRPLSAHRVAKPDLEIIKSFWFDNLALLGFAPRDPPDHPCCP
jgi:hypothetical protein